MIGDLPPNTIVTLTGRRAANMVEIYLSETTAGPTGYVFASEVEEFSPEARLAQRFADNDGQVPTPAASGNTNTGAIRSLGRFRGNPNANANANADLALSNQFGGAQAESFRLWQIYEHSFMVHGPNSKVTESLYQQYAEAAQREGLDLVPKLTFQDYQGALKGILLPTLQQALARAAKRGQYKFPLAETSGLRSYVESVQRRLAQMVNRKRSCSKGSCGA